MPQLFSQMRMSCESFGADQIPEIIYYSSSLKKVSEKSSWAKWLTERGWGKPTGRPPGLPLCPARKRPVVSLF